MDNLVVLCSFCHRQRHEAIWAKKLSVTDSLNNEDFLEPLISLGNSDEEYFRNLKEIIDGETKERD